MNGESGKWRGRYVLWREWRIWIGWSWGYSIIFEMRGVLYPLSNMHHDFHSCRAVTFAKDDLLLARFVEVPISPTKNQSLTKCLYLRFNACKLYRSTTELILSFMSWIKQHNSKYLSNEFSKKII